MEEGGVGTTAACGGESRLGTCETGWVAWLAAEVAINGLHG